MLIQALCQWDVRMGDWVFLARVCQGRNRTHKAVSRGGEIAYVLSGILTTG